MSSLRIGLVGAGFAADFHCEAYKKVQGIDCRVVAITSARAESRAAFAQKHNIPQVYASVEEMLAEAEIDVIDICAPTHVHAPAAVLAARAGKHIIMEKPLTGYTQQLWQQRASAGICGSPSLSWENDYPLLGKSVERREMLDAVMAQCEELEHALLEAGVKFCYAENWVYAPAIQKARRLIEAGQGTVLRLLAEESHSGSHASYARYWALAGGGSLLRTGSHPIGGVCYIKQVEGMAKYGQPIRPQSVMAETAFLTKIESYLAEPQHYVGTPLADCEDWGAAFITFEDGSVAEVCSSDVVLGGIYNHMQIFLSTGRIECNMNPTNAVMIYAPSEESFGEEYIAEKISTRRGWNFAAPDEHWASGYQQEIQDFAEAIVYNREPLSGWLLARDVTAVIFAAYLSAWEGRRVEVPR